MLTLVLGGSGSGKTTLLYQKMKERALAGQKSILLVPEQFTASTESRIYHELGDQYSGMVESFSFTTLAEQVLGACGGAAVKTLSEAGRVVLVRRAMQELQDSLVHYRRQKQNLAFCQMVAKTIDELKSAGIDAGQLATLAAQCGTGADKISDLALIFATYQVQVQGTALDPTDRANLAAQQLSKVCAEGEVLSFLQGRAVFIDEFDTFNAPKKNLLGALFGAVESTTVALCADGISSSGQGEHKPTFLEDVSLFSGARRVGFDLRTLARRAGVSVATPILMQQDMRHLDTPTLASINALLSGGTVQAVPVQEQTEQSFCLFAAKSREEEAQAVAAKMQQLVRAGAQYGKMAIVCRDPKHYRTVVRRACRQADIPLFCDETTNPTFSAPVTAIRALLSILRGVDYTDQMIALAKTGLCGMQVVADDGKTQVVAMPDKLILALENYVYTWSPSRSAWKEPFVRNPNGFGAQNDAPQEQEEAAALPLAEQARLALLAPIDKLCACVHAPKISATKLTKHLYHCLQALGAPEQQAQQVSALRKVAGIPASEAAAREWNVVMELLDQMVQLLGEEEVRVAEYAELFLLLLQACDLGHIPQNVDAAIFTSAGKMRLDAPEYVFVLGLAEGEFPAPPSEHSLLSDADRDALMAQNIELPDCFENKMVREDICFYKALTAPSKLLWLSWPEGLALPVTSALTPVLSHLSPSFISAETLTETPATAATAIDRLGALWGENNTQAASLYAALQQLETQTGERMPALTAFAQLDTDAPKQITKTQPLAALLGDTMHISPSRVEKYYTCPYAYFVQYLLHLRPRQKAELTANHSGNLMHWVLEKAITPEPTPYDAYKPVPFVELTAEQLKILTKELTLAYQQLYMPDDTVRFGYLMQRLQKSMVALLKYVQEELHQSKFEPLRCEAKIGEAEFPSPEYPLENGKLVKLVGFIDRIDTWQDQDGVVWMRVVDYKTGQKTFHLKEVYDGLDCQMLLYLFAALRQWQGETQAEKKAAGVLYLLADPTPQNQDREEAQKPLRPSIEGMLSAQQAVIEAVDSELTGAYLPFAVKNGNIDARAKKAKLADDEKMQRIESHLDTLVTSMAQALYDGAIAAEPLCVNSGSAPCDWCEFRAICRHEDGKKERHLTAPNDPFEAPPEPENTPEQEGE